MSPIVILGVPRSGTTLLRVLLGAHPELVAAPETPWITGGYGGSSIRHLADFLTTESIGPVRSLEGIDRSVVIRAARAFAHELLGTYVSKKGKSRLVLKTPDDIRHLNFLMELFPNATLLHVVRDGRDVACSTMRRRSMLGEKLKDYGETNIMNSLRRWRDWEYRVRQAHIQGTIQLSYSLSYEALVEDPEATLRDTADALELTFAPSMLDYGLVGQDLPLWEAGSTDVREHAGISRASVGRWKRELTVHEMRTIDLEFGEDLMAFGYRTCACELDLGA